MTCHPVPVVYSVVLVPPSSRSVTSVSLPLPEAAESSVAAHGAAVGIVPGPGKCRSLTQ